MTQMKVYILNLSHFNLSHIILTLGLKQSQSGKFKQLNRLVTFWKQLIYFYLKCIIHNLDLEIPGSPDCGVTEELGELEECTVAELKIDRPAHLHIKAAVLMLC